MRRFIHLAEAAGVYLLYGLFSLFSPSIASRIGAALARALGPRLKVSNRARRNLAMVLTDADEAERERIVLDMWANIGATLAELPHLARMWRRGRVRMVGDDMIVQAGEQHGNVLGACGHFANWEGLAYVAVACRPSGFDVGTVYRRANNPYVDWLIRHVRERMGLYLVAKGQDGARDSLRRFRAGRTILGVLADQKQNDGIRLDFMGHPAMTADGLAQLALRYNAPVIPTRVIRDGPARLTVFADHVLDVPRTGDRAQDIAAITQAVNDIHGAWIRERPAEWLWLHRRWVESR